LASGSDCVEGIFVLVHEVGELSEDGGPDETVVFWGDRGRLEALVFNSPDFWWVIILVLRASSTAFLLTSCLVVGGG
jgi:hypothetical protein